MLLSLATIAPDQDHHQLPLEMIHPSSFLDGCGPLLHAWQVLDGALLLMLGESGKTHSYC